MKRLTGVTALLALGILPAQAALTIDRSRLIYNEGEPSVSLSVTNRNEHAPYLAQGWLENEKEEKLSGPLIVLPPVQRVEPGAQTRVRIQALSDTSTLPKDRESVFYFNLREIPPKSDKPNTLTLAMQTQLKVFYRPAALKVDPKADRVPGTETVVLSRKGNRYELNNPTPYHFTFVEARASLKGTAFEDFEPVMIAPGGRTTLSVSALQLGNTPVLLLLNDYGSQIPLQFECNKKTCKVSPPGHPS